MHPTHQRYTNPWSVHTHYDSHQSPSTLHYPQVHVLDRALPAMTISNSISPAPGTAFHD